MNTSNIPGELNLRVYKNDSLTKTIVITDANNNAINLSTAIVRMQVRKKAGEIVLFSFLEGDGITVNNNQIVVDKIVDLDKGTYKHDLEVEFANGRIRTFLAGEFVVVDDITR